MGNKWFELRGCPRNTTLKELSGWSPGSGNLRSRADALSWEDGLRIFGGGHGNPLQYSCLENPQEQRILEGYSPWGHQSWTQLNQLSTHAYTGVLGCPKKLDCKAEYWRVRTRPRAKEEMCKFPAFMQDWKLCLFLPTRLENLIIHGKLGKYVENICISNEAKLALDQSCSYPAGYVLNTTPQKIKLSPDFKGTFPILQDTLGKWKRRELLPDSFYEASMTPRTNQSSNKKN